MAGMSLGDFFSNAPNARPVNPKPISFTAIASGPVLPGGKPNPTKKQVAAKIEGAFVFVGGIGADEARTETRIHLSNTLRDPETGERLYTTDDYHIELTWQMFYRVVHEWDAEAKIAGARLFPDIQTVREMLEFSEANRVVGEYYKYVAEEHPEELSSENFPEAGRRGKRLAK